MQTAVRTAPTAAGLLLSTSSGLSGLDVEMKATAWQRSNRNHIKLRTWEQRRTTSVPFAQTPSGGGVRWTAFVPLTPPPLGGQSGGSVSL
ncbi:hypothetical protein FQA47_010240 [Oryzias melastigma]|uniref:Uncharacterized protein n=1 Tax=Oryzias melastigma TaxID=30732 RepID=A0A834FJF9_ORYME|nr:hypothetical protein FQA47_010240 [Oryzias melastigma]